MAIAVLGGLFTSTMLSLLVVPAVFTYIDDFQQRVVRLFARKAQAAEEAQAAVTQPVITSGIAA
jgi:hypothetical protein